MTAARVICWLSGVLLATLAVIGSRDRAAAQAITTPEQAIIDPESSAAGDPAIATPDESGGRSANAMVLGIVPQEANDRANPLWAIPLASLSATRERPMFSPSRRPPIVKSPIISSPTIVQPDRLTLVLVGAVTGDNAIAVFRDETTKSVVRLRIGQSHSGWSLERVTERNATMRRNGELATLALPTPSAK